MTSPCAEVRRARPLLGTLVELTAIADAMSDAHAAIERGFEAAALVDARMSFHRADSDLSRIHALAWREPVSVHPWTWRVLRVATQLAEATGGLFDPTTAAALVRAGRLPSPPCDAPAPREGASWRDVMLLRDHMVHLRCPLLVDLGGIAKGFAVDRAMEAMLRAGALGAVVDAGGDLRVRWPEARRVAVRDASGGFGDVRPLVDVWDGAVATSAGYPGEDGAPAWSGIVHPRSHVFAEAATSVTVIAPSALRADALTKIIALDAMAHAGLVRRLRAEAVVFPPADPARHLPCNARGWRVLGVEAA